MDFRVSVCPTLFGEKVVLRLLDKSNLQLDMTKLGFDAEPLKWFKEAIDRPYGMVLVTGPTGSGKTTTLYSALTALNTADVNISTAEDPVEFNFAGINQVQMHDDIGLNFAAALRSFLRQDPDIIMIGEIRDFETAEIAVKAALTGHLVLSTLHTNDAPGTVSRLLNMGIEPFLVTASLNLILAQRLAPQALPGVQEARRRPSRSRRCSTPAFRRTRSARFTPYEKAGLPRVQRPRLQGPRRGLRGHAVLGRPQGAGDQRRLGGRAEAGGDPAGHADAADGGARQDDGRHDHAGRGRGRHRAGPLLKGQPKAVANLHQLLKAMVEKGASDLHITTGSPPQLRIDGELVPLKTAAAVAGGDQAALLLGPHRRAEGTSSRRTTSSTCPSA